MSDRIEYNEELIETWYKTELIYLLNGAPVDEEEGLELSDEQHLKCDKRALEIINDPTTTLKYLKETDKNFDLIFIDGDDRLQCLSILS